MIGIFHARLLGRCSKLVARVRAYSTAGVERRHDPLRILFCGSDNFSKYSLKALVALQGNENGQGKLVESIDVLCRADKRVGRGNRVVSQVPIKEYAEHLGLPIHQLDDFRTFRPSHDAYNLIVAVSFGLLIPAHLIEQIKYGGLNVHPSYLPDLRGAAPLQHTILLGRPYTGVTVQTLHPTLFDRGIPIARTEFPGFPVAKDTTVSHLAEQLGEEGARLLADVIKIGKFVPPVEELSRFSHEDFVFLTDGKGLSKAQKTKLEDSKVDWQEETADSVMRKLAVFGRIWDEQTSKVLSPGQSGTRVLYDRTRKLDSKELECLKEDLASQGRGGHIPGLPFIFQLKDTGSRKRIGYLLKNAEIIEILSCTAAGRPNKHDSPDGNGVGLLVGWIENHIRSHKSR